MFELLDATEMGRADALAVGSGISGWQLMQNAGQAVARAAVQAVATTGDQATPPPESLSALMPESIAGPIVAVAGPGNNGGDAAVAASLLAARGAEVVLLRFRPEATTQPDALQAFDSYTGACLDVHQAEGPLPDEMLRALQKAGLIIDGLFGAGLARRIQGAAADLVQAINASPARVLAIDLPSGLNGNEHTASGPVVRADRTVTFFRLKPAHLLYPGRALCGQVELAQIGIPDSVLDTIRPTARLNHPATWSWPVPQGSTHKFKRGAVLVRSGGVSHSGAARLSAAAALQCGAGLVTVACPGSALSVCAAQLTAIMVARVDTTEQWRDDLTRRRVKACVIGPGNGVGEDTAAVVLASLPEAVHCVLDADALTSFENEPDTLFDAIRVAIEGDGQRPILTPHDGEFQRLFPTLGSESKRASRLHRARAAAALSGAIIVLKGADTVIAHPDGRARINANAPPWLATAGSGDVLAGVCAGLAAQGMEAFDAASAAVWLHGQAALDEGYPMTAEQLIPACGRALHSACQAEGPPWPVGLDG